MNDSACAFLRAVLLLFVTSVLTIGAGAAGEKIVWKPVEKAAMKIDDRPPRTWDLFHSDKKDGLLLVQLGTRFLMLDVRKRQVYELDPAKLERRDKNLICHNSDRLEKPVESSEWMIRDAGRAKLIRMRLVREGRVLEVQLPLPPDWRTVFN